MLQRSNSTGAQQAFVVRTDWAQFHGNDAAHTGYNRFENTISTANAANLEALWTVPIGPTGTWSTPVIAGGKVYIGGLDGKLYGFNATTGAPSLGFPRTLGGPVQHSTAAVGFGNVYVGTGAPDGKLYAFDAATGSTVAGFPKQVGFAAYSPPALALGNVYVAEFNGNLWAFAATNGAAVPGFPKTVLNGAFGAPAISGGLVFVASRDGLLYAFDALTGNATATSPKDLGSSAMSTPVLANQQDFVTTTEGNLNYLRGLDRDLESNGTIFPLDLGNESPNNYRTPAIGGGLIVVGKPANGFTAFRPNQGFAPVWGQAFFIPYAVRPSLPMAWCS